MIKIVRLSKLAKKQLKNLPQYIAHALDRWIEDVEHSGLHQIRKIPGYHDEALQGDRFGQRSIRLNRSYRAIYRLTHEGSLKIILIEEVSKHDY